ncbi:MAG: hypothetical protein HDS01_04810 [Bacteroides sp.]|nr:hypothetical protein [Bacteroides sp.]
MLSSCSDDEDNLSSTTKRIKSILLSFDDGETIKNTFEYDSAGRIVCHSWTSSDGSDETATYEYGDSKIICTITGTSFSTISETYILTNGLVSKCIRNEYDSAKYSYDSNKRLTGIETNISSYTEYDFVKWDNDNITSLQNSTYTYSDINAMNGFDDYYNDIDWVLYNQGYFGQCSKNLYKSETSYGKTINYTHELKDGYVVKTTGSDGTIKTYTWE